MTDIKKLLAEHKSDLIKIDDGHLTEAKKGEDWLTDFPYSSKWLFLDFEKSKDKTHYILSIG